MDQHSGMEVRTVFVVLCILLTEMCERLTFYGVSANLVLYCTSGLKLTSQDAATVQLLFAGTSYLFPVLGGYVADSVSGRYNAILGSGLIYILGLFLLPACSADYVTWFGQDKDGLDYDLSFTAKRGFFLSGLALVSAGTGGIKANVGPFGAQQVSKHGPKAVQSFFNWFYWFVNLGALIAYTAVAYVQQSVSFAWGYVIPLVSMVIALVIFVAARGQYVHTQHGESVLSTSFKVCYQGCSCCSRQPQLTTSSLLDGARVKHGGSFEDATVDGVLSVLKILPIFALLLGYATVYAQMQSTFFLQSERMSVKVGGGEIPAAMLNIFNTIAILLLIPLVDRCVYPCLNRRGYTWTHLKRMGIGLVFAACSVAVAGVLEIYRKEELASSGGMVQVLGGQQFNSSQLSVLIQIPQFALIGTAEVFTSISCLEFAFTQAPASMQGLLTGLFYAVMGLGNYIATLILTIVNAATSSDPWFPDELNHGHAEYLFFLLTGLSVLSLVAFSLGAREYRYHTNVQEVTVPTGQAEEKESLLKSDPENTYGTSDTGV